MVARSPYRHLLHTVSSYSVGDPLHTNAVNVVGAEFAASHPFAEEGDLLLSFRELNAVGIVRPETEELVWATRGPWLGQHDADPLPNGNILLFDNYGGYQSEAGISRVIEFSPQTGEIAWTYGGSDAHPLDSAYGIAGPGVEPDDTSHADQKKAPCNPLISKKTRQFSHGSPSNLEVQPPLSGGIVGPNGHDALRECPWS